MCALGFVGLNGERLHADSDDIFSLLDAVAAQELDKAERSVFLMQRCADLCWDVPCPPVAAQAAGLTR
jgi:hypothetical protein